MKTNLHPKLQTVTFKCASCGATYEIETTLKQKEVNIDVCGNCHPVYVGSLSEQKVKGRAEKLSAKFDAGKENLLNKNNKDKKTRVAKKKTIITSFDEIK